MFGLIGKIIAIEGKRDELADILTGPGDMPGCVSYIVARDLEDAQALWVTEVWETKEAHAASLGLPEVLTAIRAGRSLIESFETQLETEPIGGIGLAPHPDDGPGDDGR